MGAGPSGFFLYLSLVCSLTWPQFVQVNGGAVGNVPVQVVVSHTHLTKVPGMAVQIHRKDKMSDTYNKGLKKSRYLEINVPQLKR